MVQKKKNNNITSIYISYFLGCKKYTTRIPTMTNKVLRQKSICSMRLSDKSRFSKQRPHEKVVKIHLNYYKAC